MVWYRSIIACELSWLVSRCPASIHLVLLAAVKSFLTLLSDRHTQCAIYKMCRGLTTESRLWWSLLLLLLPLLFNPGYTIAKPRPRRRDREQARHHHLPPPSQWKCYYVAAKETPPFASRKCDLVIGTGCVHRCRLTDGGCGFSCCCYCWPQESVNHTDLNIMICGLWALWIRFCSPQVIYVACD